MTTTQAERERAQKSVSERGREIYERDIKHLVEPEHIGEFLVLDVETGEFEFGPDQVVVALGFRDKHPTGERFLMRIGYRAMGAIGARLERTAR